jgi:hypothetical protein
LCPPLKIVDTVRFREPEVWKSKSVLLHNYVDLGLSTKQIADKYLSSSETIRKYLKLNEIPLRGKSMHHGNPSQVKFGQKIRNGELQDHKQERRVVESIRQMKEEGLSLRAIARCLDEMKVPTKQRGKKWHPEMVRRILDLI